jgi:hypothetical protein
MSSAPETTPTLIFIASAEMWPRQINATWPGARFIARARVPAAGSPVASYFAPHLDSEVWGVLLSIPDEIGPSRPMLVTTDDGREMTATIAGGELLDGDPEELLAAARYWELPPPFVRRLRDALAAGGVTIEDEEPRDDGNLA